MFTKQNKAEIDLYNFSSTHKSSFYYACNALHLNSKS